MYEGSPPWGYLGSNHDLPRTPDGRGLGASPRLLVPPNFESLMPAPRAFSPGFLGPFIPSPDRSWAPIPWASGALLPSHSVCPPGMGRSSPGLLSPCPCFGPRLPGLPPAPDSRSLHSPATPSPFPSPSPSSPLDSGPSPAAPGPASSSNKGSARTDGSGGSGDIRRRWRPRAPGPMATGCDPPSSLLPLSLGSVRVRGQPPRGQLRRSEAAGPPRPQPWRFAPPPGLPCSPRLPPGLPGSLPTFHPPSTYLPTLSGTRGPSETQARHAGRRGTNLQWQTHAAW